MQAQQIIQQDINVEDCLKGMSMVDGAMEYLVLNGEGNITFTQAFPSRKAQQLRPKELSICLSSSLTTGQQPKR